MAAGLRALARLCWVHHPGVLPLCPGSHTRGKFHEMFPAPTHPPRAPFSPAPARWWLTWRGSSFNATLPPVTRSRASTIWPKAPFFSRAACKHGELSR